MNNLKNNDIWYCYCVLGKIKCNAERLEYQQNWMKLYPILNDFLNLFASKSLRSYQDVTIIKKINENGYAETNSKTAKTGGTLPWNKKNNLKICLLYLQEQFEKVVELENKNIDYWDWIYEHFPTVDRYISFDENNIYAYLNKEKNIKKPGQLPDFIFKLFKTNNPNKFKGVNTEIQLSISERIIKEIGIEKADNFVLKIGEIAKAVKIGRAKSVYKTSWIDEESRSREDFPVETNFADRHNEAFSKNDRIKNWNVIFKNNQF